MDFKVSSCIVFKSRGKNWVSLDHFLMKILFITKFAESHGLCSKGSEAFAKDVLSRSLREMPCDVPLSWEAVFMGPWGKTMISTSAWHIENPFYGSRFSFSSFKQRILEVSGENHICFSLHSFALKELPQFHDLSMK